MSWTFRHSLALCWLLSTLAVAGYVLLKSSPSADDLFFLPTALASWLNVNYDLRTLLMALGVALPPALLLSPNPWRWQRRGMMSVVLALLIGGEVAQLTIATRGFGWPDIGYTVLGIVICEATASMVGWYSE